MSKWLRVDRRYDQPYRLTGYAQRALLKWVFLVVVWSVFVGTRIWLLGMAATVALGWYADHRYLVTRQAAAPRQVGSAPAPSALTAFNPPPGWPQPPAGWRPQADWQPDPAWPPAPPGWQLWIPDLSAPIGQRNTRSIPQDVKIAVSARDGGRCRQCGSVADLHFDHVIPWSKGGANTVANIQLLCGTCNRRKGADDIPANF